MNNYPLKIFDELGTALGCKHFPRSSPPDTDSRGAYLISGIDTLTTYDIFYRQSFFNPYYYYLSLRTKIAYHENLYEDRG